MKHPFLFIFGAVLIVWLLVSVFVSLWKLRVDAARWREWRETYSSFENEGV